MATVRTQICFDSELRSRIDRAAAVEDVTMAELVRRAVEQYLRHDIDPTAALAATFGAARDANVPSRDTWNRG